MCEKTTDTNNQDVIFFFSLCFSLPGWRLSWCSGWPCAWAQHGPWTGATSRPVTRVLSASKCKRQSLAMRLCLFSKEKRVISDLVYPNSTRRQRALKPGDSPYRALLETMELTNTRLTLQLINDNNKAGLLLNL